MVAVTTPPCFSTITSAMTSSLFAPPRRALRPVFENHALGLEFLTDPIRFGEVLPLSGSHPRLDFSLDFFLRKPGLEKLVRRALKQAQDVPKSLQLSRRLCVSL